MEEYIGVKLVNAYPCPAWKESGDYKIGDEGYCVIYKDGYQSWCPKKVFEESYKLLSEYR